MAKLEIELSEYDAMREARKAAETRVVELQEELKDLKKGAKVILRKETAYVGITFDTTRFEQALRKKLEQATYGATFEGKPRLNIPMVAALCIRTWEELPKEYTRNTLASEKYPTHSDTLIGFEDIRMKVEDMFKEQFKEEHRKALEALKSEKDAYKVKYNQIHEELSQEFKEIIDTLKEKSLKLVEENNALKDELKEASKSTEEKIAKAEAKVKAAQEELTRLKGKKPWWKK